MIQFKVIPVIDILNSEVVHAIKGDRDHYSPLKTYLIDSSNPLDLINSIRDKFNLNEFYMADLDSITRGIPNFRLISKILQLKNVNLMLDPGIKNFNDMKKLSKSLDIDKLIFGIETIESLELLKKAMKRIGEEHVIVSIDLYKGNIISKVPNIKRMKLIDIINKLNKINIKEIILLDLYRVGQKIGGIPNKYLEIKENFRGKIYVGGGIKNLEDIKNIYDSGFFGVLIGTAIYDGTINPKNMRKFLKFNLEK